MAEASLSRFYHPRYWPTWLGLGFMRVVSWLPLPLIAVFGGTLGLLLYALHAKRRHIVNVNVRRCFPELAASEQARIARRHFRAFGQTLLDIGISWWAAEARIKRLTRFRGREHYDQALRANKNIILLAPHFLGLEVGGIRLSIERPMVTVFRHPVNELLSVVMERARSRFQLKLIEHIKPLTALVRQTKQGVPLYYLPDQDAGRRNSVFAPFFGMPAYTMVLIARLARKTGAVLMIAYAERLSQGAGYHLHLHEAPEDFASATPEQAGAILNRLIEECVRAHPEQYQWSYKRFRVRPEGERGVY